MPGKDTEERSAHLNEDKDMLELFAFNAQIEQTYRWVTSSYSTSNVRDQRFLNVCDGRFR